MQVEPGKIFILEGIPGVGKTLLGESYAAQNENTVFLPEYLDLVVLERYLSNMKEEAFNFQMMIQKETFVRLTKAVKLAVEGKTVIVDRGLDGNKAFAYVQRKLGMITSEEFQEYEYSFDYSRIEGFDKITSKVIYMKASPSFCLKRIESRGRESESCYDLTYLSALNAIHDMYFLGTSLVVKCDHDHQLTCEGQLPREVVFSMISTAY